MKTHKQIILTFLCVFAFASQGCVDLKLCDKFEVHYRISDDLKGELTLVFVGVSFPKETMKEFYDQGYINDPESEFNFPGSFQKLFAMDSSKTEIFDKTDTTCNVKVHGKIGWFPSSLAALMSREHDVGFVLQKVGDYLYVTIGIESNSNSDTISIFTLEYNGYVVANNANEYDETSHRLQWEVEKIQPPGIYFVLDTDL
jgi:hypothetical protein